MRVHVIEIIYRLNLLFDCGNKTKRDFGMENNVLCGFDA